MKTIIPALSLLFCELNRQPIPMSDHTTETPQSLRLNRITSIQLLLLPVSPLDTTEKSLAPSPLNTLIRYLCTLLRFPWVFISRLKSHRSFDFSICQILQSLHVCDHLLDLLLDVHVFLVLGSQDLDTALSCVSPERKDCLPLPAGGRCWSSFPEGCIAGSWSTCYPPRF